MNLGTFYQTSAYLCMCLIAFNLAFAFMVGLGVFGSPATGGIQLSGDTDSDFSNITELEATNDEGAYTGMNALWVIVGGSAVGVVGGLLLGFVTHSSVFVGVGLFSGVFWSSYLNSLVILQNMNILVSLAGFMLIGTILMVFMFAGAVIGMLSGSG